MKRFKKKQILTAMFVFLVGLIFINSCKKKEVPDPDLPPNPYDGVNYDTLTNNPAAPDPNSFVGIHNNILKPRCAVPGCHDGNFEPDYRTIESSYATLVWHKIVKNSADSSFTFRVVPYNKTKSVLHERITNCNFAYQGANDCMPQDNIGTKLPQSMIDNIANWISSGAKDMFGNSPTYPNTEPKILYYFATNQLAPGGANYGATENRMDSIYYNPFYLPNDTTVYIAIVVEDDSTAISALQVNKLKLSLNADNFSAPLTTYQASYINFPGVPEFYLVTLNTSALPKNDTIFMRYHVKDQHHSYETYFPTENLPFPYKTYWSFFIKP